MCYINIICYSTFDVDNCSKYYMKDKSEMYMKDKSQMYQQLCITGAMEIPYFVLLLSFLLMTVLIIVGT